MINNSVSKTKPPTGARTTTWFLEMEDFKLMLACPIGAGWELAGAGETVRFNGGQKMTW
jgi:hypothetical protein